MLKGKMLLRKLNDFDEKKDAQTSANSQYSRFLEICKNEEKSLTSMGRINSPMWTVTGFKKAFFFCCQYLKQIAINQFMRGIVNFCDECIWWKVNILRSI